MNLVYLHSHDTGRYISPLGHAVATPALMSLAREGACFRNAHSAAPTCSPSRAALLTGLWAHSAGMLGLAHRGFALPDYRPHLASHLREHGYTTALSGIEHESCRQHAMPAGLTYGLDLGRDSRSPHPAAVDFLRSVASVPPKARRPFFLSVGFFATHREAEGFALHDPADDPAYVLVPPTLADTAANRLDVAGLHSSLRGLDAGIGEVLSALRGLDLLNQTLIVATTDHGLPFPDMKCRLTSHGTGVFLLLSGPGVPAGRVHDALVSQIDLFPTLCSLLGVSAPAGLQGHSLVDLLGGRTDRVREELFAEVNYHAAYEPQRAVRTLSHVYIRRYHSPRPPILANCDDGPAKRERLDRTRWASRPLATEQMHDLLLDPQEMHNLADGPDHRDTLNHLRGRLDAWMQATCDPLLQGDIPLPPGAVANLPTDASPNLAPRLQG